MCTLLYLELLHLLFLPSKYIDAEKSTFDLSEKSPVFLMLCEHSFILPVWSL